MRQYFPKGTDLSRRKLQDLLAVQAAINSRPRKVLDWKSPAEVLDEHLQSRHQAGVATTGRAQAVHLYKFGKALRASGLLASMGRASMGRVGSAVDNAMTESVFATLKTELIYRRARPTHHELEVEVEVFAHLEGLYNTRRRHLWSATLAPPRTRPCA